MNRRHFLAGGPALVSLAAGILSAENNPWSRQEVIEPEELAGRLKAADHIPTILCVGFPSLYKQRHIPHARLAGPGSKPEGKAELDAAVSGLARDTEVVLYCGCCPMPQCPNIRPAYQALKDLEFTRIRILNLPTSFHADWVEKGYPVEE